LKFLARPLSSRLDVQPTVARFCSRPRVFQDRANGLLEVVADGLPNAADQEPFLTVFEAARRGDWPLAGAVMQAHPDLAQPFGANGNTLVNLAASLLACPTRAELEMGHARPDRLDAMRMLLSADAPAAAPNERGWTPLHQAAYRNDPAMVALLLEWGASPHAIAHGSGGTPLAIALFRGHRYVASCLPQPRLSRATCKSQPGSVGRIW